MPEIHFWQGLWRGSAPDGGAAHRAREVVRYTGGIVRGKFPSRKNRRMVHHEGLLELDAIYLFETSPLIVSYREQPITIRYLDCGQQRRYTPDFELTLVNGRTVMVEIKPQHSLNRPDIAAKLAAVSRHFDEMGTPFTVLDDRILRLQPRLASLKIIWHGLPRHVPTAASYRNALRQAMGDQPLAFAELQRRLKNLGTDIFGALVYGLLHFNLSLHLQSDTPLFPIQENEHEWFRIAPQHGF
ncbi:Tn7 transposase TnsA N-terminal domain-containing protein [Chitinimonas viridis]|uniref:Tn7 transposase TnsA N-terminal domain-containing protein n=1 Tax=Chitinimonas viridis TaxID=664880 RepID=A0ABT8B0D8_9NEIS|nr:Tn7 transposase TnsA N-terminal domain-containing protein [Chitinimonas viridis]MDN3575694.1 Tn7 transposase TnsA N-terminal domain-containing protein [Chitinimonas viridis]